MSAAVQTKEQVSVEQLESRIVQVIRLFHHTSTICRLLDFALGALLRGFSRLENHSHSLGLNGSATNVPVFSYPLAVRLFQHRYTKENVFTHGFTYKPYM